MNALLNTLVALLALVLGGVVLTLFVIQSVTAFYALVPVFFVILAALFVATEVDHRRKMTALRTR